MYNHTISKQLPRSAIKIQCLLVKDATVQLISSIFTVEVKIAVRLEGNAVARFASELRLIDISIFCFFVFG